MTSLDHIAEVMGKIVTFVIGVVKEVVKICLPARSLQQTAATAKKRAAACQRVRSVLKNGVQVVGDGPLDLCCHA
jgi:hypothetical protein